tara:strand:- start:99 stop:443 length:345 start_codon:yes stop_codon:yes gene_type:complete
MNTQTKQELRQQIESLESRIVELQKQEHLRRPNTIVLTNEEVAQILDLIGRAKGDVGHDIHEREMEMSDDLSSSTQIALYQYECSLGLLCTTITNQCESEFAFRTSTQKVEVKI